MKQKEASARIKINKLLEESGWRFDADKNGPANIQLEPGVKYSELGDDFEHEVQGFIDFLLLDKGYAVHATSDDGELIDKVFNERHYERKFFNEETNIAMCKAFIDNGLFDPAAEDLRVNLFGKSIVFCVSQKHAARITNVLNKLAFDKDTDEAFNFVDGYKDSVKKFIWTDININMHTLGHPAFIQSRVQVSLSSVLLRSLFLRDGIVHALNENNLPVLFAVLKSFLEISAILAYILDLLDRDISDRELLEKFANLTLGNKEAGEMSISKRDAVNVLTMFKKLERILGDFEPTKNGITMPSKILSDFYKDICNSGHPNFDAHMPIGQLTHPGIWKATKIESFKKQKEEFWGGYMPHFQIALVTISYLCEKITNHPKIKNFSGIGSKSYF